MYLGIVLYFYAVQTHSLFNRLSIHVELYYSLCRYSCIMKLKAMTDYEWVHVISLQFLHKSKNGLRVKMTKDLATMPHGKQSKHFAVYTWYNLVKIYIFFSNLSTSPVAIFATFSQKLYKKAFTAGKMRLKWFNAMDKKSTQWRFIHQN